MGGGVVPGASRQEANPISKKNTVQKITIRFITNSFGNGNASSLLALAGSLPDSYIVRPFALFVAGLGQIGGTFCAKINLDMACRTCYALPQLKTKRR
jgi:hypothetical protein